MKLTQLGPAGAVQKVNTTGPGGVAVVLASDVLCLGSYNTVVSLIEALNATGVLYLTEKATPYTLFGDSSERCAAPPSSSKGALYPGPVFRLFERVHPSINSLFASR